MSALDLVVIAVYLAAVVAVNRHWAGKVDFAGWLTSKNTIGTGFLVFTVVSTNVGAGTMVGTAGSTYASGMGLGFTGGIGVMIGFWVMAAVTGRLRRLTPAGERTSFSEFFRQRYSREVQVAVGVIIAILYFFYLAAQFKGLASMIEIWGGWDARLAGFAAALLVIWMTAGSGIRSDMYTDVIHFWAMFLTIGLACVLEVAQMGGPTALLDRLRAQGALAQLLDPYAFAGKSYVWLGIPVGALLGLPAFENWQRVDAARSARHARWAFFLAGILNAMFFASAVLLGFVARAVLEPGLPKNHVFFRLIEHTLPPGFLGLGVVGAFAAIMSTANSMLMVSVAAILGDVMYPGDPKLAARPHVLHRTRLLTWIVGGIGLAIAAWRPDIVSLILTGLWGSGVLIPAIIGGLWWRRGNSAAALASVVTGFFLTFTLAYVPALADTSWMLGLAVATGLFLLISAAGSHEPGERVELSG